ncbi:LOW QUALITY PROTEIN: peroxiredoxin-4-like [Falco biarmicus]|uniref:LOW QUALITY PROTEIN: peroxiredoxin-4-like n=1 Tax=Falco rusticolus TaxID=120794 RepID=UPI0018867540|nr:LOW QUALITY PROTEIN: peroxiredoxin-4-like [Falco rusticolus]XP_056181088.1 LOW QUALITY PROTEIN: peroxiredoxin-4-like [Falco biarmicus]
MEILGVKDLDETLEPQSIQLPVNVRTLNDLQKLLGTINWVRPYLGLKTDQLKPLFDLLKGDTDLMSPQSLTKEATLALEKLADGLQQKRAKELRTARQWEDKQCHYYTGGWGGQVYPGDVARVPISNHLLHFSQAKISKPAPYWEGTADINGEFKELKLIDYEGKHLVILFYPLDLINTSQKQEGLGLIRIPLLLDLIHHISKDYRVYLEDQGHTLRGLFFVGNKRILQQITMDDLPVGRSVDKTLSLVQAYKTNVEKVPS